MSSVPPPPPVDPYQPPQTLPTGPSAATPAQVASDVAGPAVGLIITAVLGAIFPIFGLLINALGAGLGAIAAEGSEQQIVNLISMGVGIFPAAAAIVMAAFIIYAALEMKKLRQWGLAVAASTLTTVFSLFFCLNPCCVVGLPIGIWSLVILMRDDVRAAFQ